MSPVIAESTGSQSLSLLGPFKSGENKKYAADGSPETGVKGLECNPLNYVQNAWKYFDEAVSILDIERAFDSSNLQFKFPDVERSNWKKFSKSVY